MSVNETVANYAEFNGGEFLLSIMVMARPVVRVSSRAIGSAEIAGTWWQIIHVLLLSHQVVLV